MKLTMTKTNGQEDLALRIGCSILILACCMSIAQWVYGGPMFAKGAFRFASTSKSAGAFGACQNFVSNRLKSPSSAHFAHVWNSTITADGTGDGSYTVVSHVDAQNGFGATLRTSFVCQVRPYGAGWELKSLDIE